MAEVAVGIDLGTSNTCVSLMRGGEVEVLPNAFGERTSASVVHFHEDGSVEVGNSAKAKVIHAPAQTVSSAKRLIGRYYFSEEVNKAQAIYAYEIVEAPNHGIRISVRDEEFSLPEISAMILREMKQIAESHTGEKVHKAVITVPAYFNDNQRQATKDAGRIAGLDVLRILNEPTAAALAYGFGMGLNQRVAVYDLGGGTFDISILEIGKDIFEVLATCGDTFLGGDDFDDRLIDLLADEFVASEGINPRNDPYAFEKLKVAAENAKKQLSVDEEVQIDIDAVLVGEDGEPRGLQRKITRADLAQLVQDLIQRTFKVCDEALQQSDLTVRDLDGVILVGGPTRLPTVREAVTHYFQQEPRADIDPDEVVAMGAAIHAASLVGEAQDSMLLDVTPLDLRIGVAGGLTEIVIERNTPVPIEQTRTFTTFQDFQESVEIKVYQGDHRLAEENVLLGQFGFSGFEPRVRSDVKIDVTFEIDADGIVNVTAADQATGEATSTRITLASGLDERQMEKIIDDDRANRVQTAGMQSATAAAVVAAAAAAPPPADDSSSLFDTSGTPLRDDQEQSASLDLDLTDDDSTELELLGNDDLMQMTQDAPSLSEDNAITLDVPADEIPDNPEEEELFESSGGDLSFPDPETEIEEER
ncbi:MAG: Hsp70 family protein [Deltaproteobacteria bacterium]|jgi:molecular chaperone DnaK|nr:Hsp70 family protein [Deltaproteobacteria bacterium]MBW2497318.1 Hsp70 family protein [Deltaproteobacteria bacterium]